MPAGDHDAMAEVRRNVRVPIIADESVYTLADAKMLARAEAADVFSIYIGKAGGIGPAREIAEFAQSVGIKCTIGSNLELGVGSAAMIHLALVDARHRRRHLSLRHHRPDVLRGRRARRAAADIGRIGAACTTGRDWAWNWTTRRSRSIACDNSSSLASGRRFRPARSAASAGLPSGLCGRRRGTAVQSYFQSPGMRAKRLACVGTPSGPRRTTPRL